MQDLKNHQAIWFKGIVFLLIAIVSSVLLLLEVRTVRGALLLVLAIWASCRAYYFAFYVIQHYVDPGFRFSGLGSFILYALRKRQGTGKAEGNLMKNKMLLCVVALLSLVLTCGIGYWNGFTHVGSAGQVIVSRDTEDSPQPLSHAGYHTEYQPYFTKRNLISERK